MYEALDVVEFNRIFDALFDTVSHGQRLGRYVVLGTLGRGAMGTVLKAFDRKLDRRVAIKVLRRGVEQQYAKRLVREAQALAKLSHPNVVHVYEVDEVDGQNFVVMELVPGRTLHEWMQQQERRGWKECVEVFLQVGAGLAAAHARGLVHRDFKPSNAIIDESGRVRVLDFGLARKVDRLGLEEQTTNVMGAEPDLVLSLSLTQTGTVLGTPAYMPLEQMQGGEADARSDQFSFCAALYEALYGERPYEGESLAGLVIAMRGGVVRVPIARTSVPRRLRRALLRGLAADPEDRWPSMDALLVELRRVLAPRRKRWVTIALVGGMLAAGFGLARYMGDMKWVADGGSGNWMETYESGRSMMIGLKESSWSEFRCRIIDQTRGR
ncbi:MAG: serine/threonine-protein kinase [Myxococcota bacterium]